MTDPEGMLTECLQVGCGNECTVGDIVGLSFEIQVLLYLTNGLKRVFLSDSLPEYG